MKGEEVGRLMVYDWGTKILVTFFLSLILGFCVGWGVRDAKR